MIKSKILLWSTLILPMLLSACGGGGNPSTGTSTSGGDTSTSRSTPTSSYSRSDISGHEWNVTSPDGSLCVYVNWSDSGKLYYDVSKNGKNVLELTSLSFYSSEASFGMGDSSFILKGNPVIQDRNVQYSNITGKSSEVDLDYRELAVTTWDGAEYDFTITFRVFDDGFGFNYNITKESLGSGDKITEVREGTNIKFPKSTKFWTMNYKEIKSGNVHNCFAYEEDYTKKTMSAINNAYVSLPFTALLGETEEYMTFQESGLIGSGFYGSMMYGDGESDSTNRTFHLEHTPASVCLEKASEFELDLPFSSPWRVGAIGDLAQINDTELFEAILGDVTPYSPNPAEPIEYEDFVEGGTAGWHWLLHGGASNFDLHETYLNTAIAEHWSYYLMDAGWLDASSLTTKLKTLSNRAHANGVKILGWVYAYSYQTKTLLLNKFKEWKGWGLDGIKIDFFDGQNEIKPAYQGEDKMMIKHYQNVYEAAAEVGFTVNPHGSNKPTGERRMYPNVINREAIKGYENKGNVSSKTVIDSLFTRAVVGPTDFTPTVTTLSENLSSAALNGLTICYESGQTSASGRMGYDKDPNDYLSNDIIKEFYDALPAGWDESHYLDGELDKSYSVARRKGDNWFVGGICNAENYFEFKLDFLEAGSQYEAYIIRDDVESESPALQMVTEKIDVTSATELSIDCCKNGGFAIKIVKKA